MLRLFAGLTVLLMLTACGGGEPGVGEGAPLELDLMSSAFGEGDLIPARYTCDGEDVSPPLSWSAPPAETESLVLIVDDPDAPVGTWVHWVVFDLPPGTRALPEAVPPGEALAAGGIQGQNSWRNSAYGGPCPPGNSEHGYVFRLYALDVRLDLGAEADKGYVEEALAGHVLVRGQLTGRYGR